MSLYIAPDGGKSVDLGKVPRGEARQLRGAASTEPCPRCGRPRARVKPSRRCRCQPAETPAADPDTQPPTPGPERPGGSS